jgi:DNA-binding LacI/PurR family transcriptional regulator
MVTFSKDVNVHIADGVRYRPAMETDRVRAPNIRDVARLAGVSYQTVSRVLNNSESIKPSTKQRVLDVIAEIGYRPNQAARALVTSKSRTLGVLTAQTAHYGPAMSLRAIETAARDAGYLISTTSLVSSDYDSIRQNLEHLTNQMVEGLIVIAPQVQVFDAIKELDIRIPLVTLDSTGRDAPRSLSVDQISGAKQATRYLIELGHKEIVHLAGPQDWIEAEARMQGFLEEINDADLRTHPPILGDWTAQFGYRAGRELAPFRDFTAVFAANDQMALGLMHAFREAGLDIPGDVSVVGFDDIPEARHYWPPLTTVHLDFTEIGRRAVSILLGELHGETHAMHEQILPTLRVRESAARR